MDTGITRPVVMEVSLSNFEHNISQIKACVGEDVTIMPVIKGNAYGTYLNKKLEVLNKFAESLNEVSMIETEPKLEGKQMYLLLAPKK